jgi:tRNA pseudouridine38-40 synthase
MRAYMPCATTTTLTWKKSHAPTCFISSTPYYQPDCRAIDPEFNARFEAIRRRYRYRIYCYKNPFLLHKAFFYPFTLKHDILDETAAIIKEYTQFESFSKRNAQSHTFNCTIYQSYWEQVGDELHYVVEGNRFLRGMVRGLVGTQLKIAREKTTIQGFRNIIEAHDCTKAFFNVPGHGLYLEEITYPEGTFEVLQQQ